jgi:hypothetical protein
MLGIRHRTRPPFSRPRYPLLPCFGLPICSLALRENIGLPSLGVKESISQASPPPIIFSFVAQPFLAVR